MGMTMKARRIPAATLQTATTDELHEWLGWGLPGRIDLDKAWDGIAWLISEERRERPYMLPDPSLPETQAIYGTDRQGEGLLFRYSPAQVVRIAEALRPLREEDLRRRFAPAEMLAAEVYPRIWDEGEEVLDYLLTNYRKLRALYLDAAAAKDGVVSLIG